MQGVHYTLHRDNNLSFAVHTAAASKKPPAKVSILTSAGDKNFEHKKTVKQAKSYSPAKQIAVPSALEGLTSGFGMGPGGPPPLFSPASTALSKLVKRSFARFTRLTTRLDTFVSAEVSHLLSPRLRTKRIINRLRPRRFSTG